MSKHNHLAKSDAPSGAVCVAGGGIAGMQAALDLAGAGFHVHLVERGISIGGIMAMLDKTFPTNDCSTCMISPKLIEVSVNPNIEIISRATIIQAEGQPGDLRLKVRREPRFIDEAKCTGCGDCVAACPVEVPADFNLGLNQRKAIYRHFPQAVPSAYAIDHSGISPCRAACPAGVSAQGYVALIAQGRYQEALRLVRRDNPLPGICGRVCTHPCEEACTRAELDEPVAIRELKRFAADWEVVHGKMDLPEIELQREQKVAVIGSGPAGLSAAYYLALDGYQVTIFEALSTAGGMLRVGIPAYRLPREVIDYEIAYIQALGVEIKLNSPVGPDLSLADLKAQGFGAVFMSVGAHKGMRLGVEGEGLPGVQSGVEFLRRAALGQAASPGNMVVVIGGGNVAIDAARTALRLGSKQVTILYRRSQDEMPAYEAEIEEALEEGIEIELLAAPTGFTSQDGRLVGVKVIRTQLGEPDASGRRRPVPIEGSEYWLECDGALSAIGQSPDVGFLEPRTDGLVDARSRLMVDPVTLATSLDGVFAGGDAVLGPASAIEAVAMGKKAAQSIGRYLRGEEQEAGNEDPPEPARPATSSLARAPRMQAVHAMVEKRTCDFREVAAAFSEEQARAEAARCLACGICSECYQCVEVCRAEAINHDMQPEEIDLRVGAVIMAPGLAPFDARLKPEFGYGRWANVVTSLEFERLNSASGPTGGHLQRPGDGREPKRVAWIQCVGSRDPSIGRDFCSYVCCMYATKQAIIGQEHVEGLAATVFYMDIRAQGKGFDRYYERARDQHGVRYLRSIPSRIIEDPVSGDLQVQYFDDNDELCSETFDMVVLSIGVGPSPHGIELAEVLGVETNRFGFAASTGLNPLATSAEGVYVCGGFQAPRDIPDTVMQASGAAAQAGELLAPARGSEIRVAEWPQELEVVGQEPRIGVFVCHCGINIGSVVDVPGVVEYIARQPGVVMAKEFLFTCSTDSTAQITQAIGEHQLNRVVVASCSPRTHEPLFRDCLRQAGLNPYLFEMANIRDQCSWVHAADHAAATEKSMDLVRMSVARARLLEPLHQFPSPVEQSALVVGGGAAGMTAALSLAEQGFHATLLEKTDQLGGMARHLDVTLEGFEVGEFLEDLIDQVTHNGLIEVLKNAEVLETKGHVGQLVSQVRVEDQTRQVTHGAVIIASGAQEYQPIEYAADDQRVMTQLGLHQALHRDPDALADVNCVVMIQCVGSREEEHSYCSRVCCSLAVSNALAIKQLKPQAEVSVLFRDMRTFGLKEVSYQQARLSGVNFIRFDPEQPPEVIPGQERLTVKVYDTILGRDIELAADRVALAAAIRPASDAADLASSLKLPLDSDGFFMEAHLKLRPVDFVNAGYFMAGLAHGPKFLEESISQAKAAAARAATILSQSELMVGGEVAVVDAERCVACLTCVRTCPYGVPQINQEGVAYIDPAACQGCGNCAAACPRKLIEVHHHTDSQILAKVTSLWEETGS